MHLHNLLPFRFFVDYDIFLMFKVYFLFNMYHTQSSGKIILQNFHKIIMNYHKVYYIIILHLCYFSQLSSLLHENKNLQYENRASRE